MGFYATDDQIDEKRLGVRKFFRYYFGFLIRSF